MKKDQDQDHVEMITMAVQNDQEWKAPQRRGMGSFVSGNTPRAHRSDGFGDQYTDQEELFTPDKQTLEQLESKLTRMEDLLLKILVSLQDKDNVTMRDKPSGASTSYVWHWTLILQVRKPIMQLATKWSSRERTKTKTERIKTKQNKNVFFFVSVRFCFVWPFLRCKVQLAVISFFI